MLTRTKKLHTRTLERIRTSLRIERRNMGLTNIEIAKMLGMKVGAYNLLRTTETYKRMKNEYMVGVYVRLDKEIDEKYNQDTDYERLAQGVPSAIENLFTLATQDDGGDIQKQKVKLEASKEILDRHGRYAKVSRIGLPTKDQGSLADAKDNEVASELINVLAEAKNIQRVAEERDKEVTINSEPVTKTPQ